MNREKLEMISKDLGVWLLDNGYVEMFDSEEEANLILKGLDDIPNDAGFKEAYRKYHKEIAVIFRRQEKTFKTRTIVDKLTKFRPRLIQKAKNYDLEDFTDKSIADTGFLKMGNPVSEKIINDFVKLIFGYSKTGYDIGGNVALKKIKYSLNKSGNKAAKEVAADIKTSFNLTNKGTLNFLENYAGDRVSQLNKTTKERLRNIIVDRYKKGVGPAGIAEAIRDEFNDFSKTRSKIIAMTELSIASGNANLESYIRREIPEKRWLARGPNPCPLCLANAAEGSIKINASWATGVMTVPMHPNCKCAIAPEIGEFWLGGDKVPGHTWYGGVGGERTTKELLPREEKEVKWKPVMTKEEAEKWAKDSKLKQTFYHGTTNEFAEKIRSSGFRESQSGAFGSGVYVTESKVKARFFGKSVLPLKVKIRGKLLDNKSAILFGNLSDKAERNLLDKIRAIRVKEGKHLLYEKRIYNDDVFFAEELAKEKKKLAKGYSGVIIRNPKTNAIDELIVWNPKNIVIFFDE